MENQYHHDYTPLIKKHIQSKIESNTSWENEYGIVCNTSMIKDNYKTINDFKVLYYSSKGKIYFKIVPTYFCLPNSQIYWNYYDGHISHDKIHWHET